MTRHDLARSSARLGSRSSSARGSAWLGLEVQLISRLGLARPRGPAQLEARLIEARGLGHLGSALGSAGYSGFGSSPPLAQARLGTPDLGSGINPMLGSAQLGVWLGLSSCIDSGLATQDSTWLGSGLSSAYLERGHLH